MTDVRRRDLRPASRRRKRIPRALRPTRASWAPQGSKVLSLGALLSSALLLVGMSVPANAFMRYTSPVPETKLAEWSEPQSLHVASDSVEGPVARDGFEVLSYAQVLAIKYAGVDYSYAATSGAVRWPFPYSVPINDGFGPRSDGFHKGIDMMAGAGTPIYAIADGVASTATYDSSGYGQHVVISHDLGGVKVESLYAHMIEGSSPIVRGQEIKVGDFLGLVGDTGYATAVHLHFEIHIDGVPVDPFAWLSANAV